MKKIIILTLFCAFLFSACQDSQCNETDLPALLQSKKWTLDGCECVTYQFSDGLVTSVYGCPALASTTQPYQIFDNIIRLRNYDIEVTEVRCNQIDVFVFGCDGVLK